MTIVKGMGGGEVRAWTEDDFVWVATAPTGRNEYAVCLFPEDAMKVVAAIARAAREATDAS
jgi:hypothetical protein